MEECKLFDFFVARVQKSNLKLWYKGKGLIFPFNKESQVKSLVTQIQDATGYSVLILDTGLTLHIYSNA